MGRPNKNSHNLKRLLQEAIQLHQRGNFSGAEVLYRKMLLSQPNHPDVLHLLGVMAYQRGDNNTAVSYIKKAISINSGISAYHNNLGSAFLNLNRTEEAILCFEAAVRLQPDYAEACNNLGNALKQRGRYEDARKQYQKAICIKSDYSEAHNNLANLLIEEGSYEDAIMHFQTAIALKPKFAEAYFNYGNVLVKMERFDEAIEQYHHAIDIKPEFHIAYNNLGNALKQQGRIEEAMSHYHRSLVLLPNFAEAYNNLGDAYRILKRFDEAIENCRKAIQLSPGNSLFYCNLGDIFSDQDDLSEAVNQYNNALQVSPDCAVAHYNRGLILLLQGKFEEGWREYEWRFKCDEIIRDIVINKKVGIPEWDGSQVSGKTLLIRSEQGVGDNIQFIRYLPLLKKLGWTIVYECHKDMIRLFDGYQGIDCLIEEPFNDHTMNECRIKPDYYVFLMSLPRILGATLNTIPYNIPYLKVSDGAVNKWRSFTDSIYRLPTAENRQLLKVGIVWAGNPKHKNDRNRSCSFSDFIPLTSLRGVVLYSLQKGHGTEQMHNQPHGLKIIDLGEKLEDFYDTAAAIMNLDLVISVDTSVVHLAGALGKTVWTLLPFRPDWRWMANREDTPWYPTMRLFRRTSHGDWKAVIDRVAHELEKLASAQENIALSR